MMDSKKYRLLLDGDDTIPSSSPSSQSHTLNNRIDSSFVMMEDTSSASPPSQRQTTKPKGSGRGRKPAHELLSEDQKKANHIASEQKRRANIRIGFDQLVDIVPTLNECQRSESLILQKCKFLIHLYEFI
ncbi:uncharacterized protein BX664DRAFT_36239 [Halteromyces radiatus]|uniref:uncharacterized protein n=1 Tax=Halteromyces radiatus TaxID=101107 RepID=UPI00221FA8C0|nr:uncharacterized protein BX664DRAFT_36239 [Halteromyces radiatus]KAI8078630.1 hypothetical protein BX664DRAFT_36239 [Halteromyces radiatus]